MKKKLLSLAAALALLAMPLYRISSVDGCVAAARFPSGEPVYDSTTAAALLPEPDRIALAGGIFVCGLPALSRALEDFCS